MRNQALCFICGAQQNMSTPKTTFLLVEQPVIHLGEEKRCFSGGDSCCLAHVPESWGPDLSPESWLLCSENNKAGRGLRFCQYTTAKHYFDKLLTITGCQEVRRALAQNVSYGPHQQPGGAQTNQTRRMTCKICVSLLVKGD